MSVKKHPNPYEIPSTKASEQVATRKMLYLVRDELRSELRSGIQSLESKMEQRFGEMDARFVRMELRLEEQNSNNRIVLEGLQALWQRQERVDSRLAKLERTR
jgi:predicted nuclease with TOPRIM domain